MAPDLRIVRMTNTDERFYATIGPFLSRREIVRELGAPVWDEDDKEWFVAMRGRKLSGFAAIRRLRCNKTALVSAYVLPEFRKTGVYSALLAARLAAVTGPVRAVATAESVPALRNSGLKSTGKRGRFTVMERS